MSHFDVAYEQRQVAKRDSFLRNDMPKKQANYQQLKTTVTQDHKDRMPAIKELESRRRPIASTVAKTGASVLQRGLRATASVPQAVVSPIYYIIKESPKVFQAPFNQATKGLFCCISVETHYDASEELKRS
jgi:hypothetical protein